MATRFGGMLRFGRRIRTQNFNSSISCSSLSSKVNLVFIEKKTTFQKKFVTVKEELVSIDIDSIGNLEDLPRLVFNNEGCWNLTEKELYGIDIDEILKDVTRLLFFYEESRNLTVFVDIREVTRNINK